MDHQCKERFSQESNSLPISSPLTMPMTTNVVENYFKESTGIERLGRTALHLFFSAEKDSCGCGSLVYPVQF